MGHRFAELAFSPNVQAVQTENGSRKSYVRMEGGEDYNNKLGRRRRNFSPSATVSTWPA